MLFWIIVIVVAAYACYRIDKYFHDQRIDDVSKKCVFVTGCDSGFGSILPVRLDAYGVTCFAGCLTEAGIGRLKEKCSANVIPLRVDVANSESIQQAFEYVKANIPPGKEFWAVLNNAGYNGPGGPIEFMTRAEFLKVFDVNFFGQAEVSRIFLPLLKQSKGRIINVSSCTGRLALTMNHPYVASKWAVEGLSDAIRREKAVYGVSVSVIEPGGFRTGMFDYDVWVAMKDAQWENLPRDIRQEYGNEFLDDVKKQRRHLTANLTKPDMTPVIDAYDNALFSKYPRYRYAPGWDGTLYVTLSMLPDAITDFFVAKLMKAPKPLVLR